MRICIIAPADNYHTKKWCKWFSDYNHEVHVISFTYSVIPEVDIHFIDTGVDVEGSDGQKIKYLFQAGKLKKILNSINPDIVSVHYATSYGTVVALSGLRGYVLSVWGSDVYDFPKKSPIHQLMLKYSLRKAGYVFSTSQAMANETHKYTKKDITVTPFGVDMRLFNPEKRNRNDSNGEFIVGTVKALHPKYGIDYLLKAVKIANDQEKSKQIKLRIAGKGPYADEYKKLAEKLELDVEWLGFISQDRAAKEWANMDIGIIPSESESESFGVSAVEVEACGVPVIISNIPGLMEATDPGNTSIVVKRRDAHALANAILELKNDPERRKKMGIAGREYACSNFELNFCFRKIEKEFLTICGNDSR